MGIENFPSQLQPIIQQGYLERMFEQPLTSRLAYRAVAERVPIQGKIGDVLTQTRPGLLAPVTTALNSSNNTNIDNGLTPQYWTVEQWSVVLGMYAATQDLNMVTSRTALASVFQQNAYNSGFQARQSLDRLARNALFNAYLGGNTRVITALNAPSLTVHVDDVRGFQFIYSWNGTTAPANGSSSPTYIPVSSSNPLSVTIGSDTYSVTSVAVDNNNISTAPQGISGVLTLQADVSQGDGYVGSPVIASNAPLIWRPNGRSNTSILQSTDTLAMSNLIHAVAALRANNVPTVDGSTYNCYLDPISSSQLFADPDFKQLYQGQGAVQEFKEVGLANPFVGLRFLPTTEAIVQAHPSIQGLNVRRAIICGMGCLIEGDFADMAAREVAPADSMVWEVDNVCMVIREPLDRLQQIIAQSWYWIGGFSAPTDIVSTTATIPTASNSDYKRAVIIEHVG